MTLNNKNRTKTPFHYVQVDESAWLAIQKHRLELLTRGERRTILEATSEIIKRNTPNLVKPTA